MNIFVYDEHTPAQAKKQAGRESFLRISSGQTLPLLGDHELALDVALQSQRKLTPHLRSAEIFKVRGIEIAPRTQSTKKTSSANPQIHHKKENRHLQIKHVGCILDEFEMMFQPNRRLTRLLLSTLLL